MSEDKPIEYRFLDMDHQTFAVNQEQLVNDVGRRATLRVIPNDKYNQVLVAAGRGFFSERQAVLLCKELSFGEA